MASSHRRKQLATTTESSTPRDERLREETRYYASGLQHRGLLVVDSRGQVANSRPNRINISRDNRSYPKHAT
ncbi:hypothetical protein AAG906_016345 [Vitis piasezkii]